MPPQRIRPPRACASSIQPPPDGQGSFNSHAGATCAGARCCSGEREHGLVRSYCSTCPGLRILSADGGGGAKVFHVVGILEALLPPVRRTRLIERYRGDTPYHDHPRRTNSNGHPTALRWAAPRSRL